MSPQKSATASGLNLSIDALMLVEENEEMHRKIKQLEKKVDD